MEVVSLVISAIALLVSIANTVYAHYQTHKKPIMLPVSCTLYPALEDENGCWAYVEVIVSNRSRDPVSILSVGSGATLEADIPAPHKEPAPEGTFRTGAKLSSVFSFYDSDADYQSVGSMVWECHADDFITEIPLVIKPLSAQRIVSFEYLSGYNSDNGNFTFYAFYDNHKVRKDLLKTSHMRCKMPYLMKSNIHVIVRDIDPMERSACRNTVLGR